MARYNLIKVLLILTLFFVGLTPLYAQHSEGADIDKVSEDRAQGSVEKYINDTSTEKQIFIPGDALKIIVYPDTAGFPNGIYHINEQGYVRFPIIGYRKVVDKSVKKLESLLMDAYVDYLPRANIHVLPLIRAGVIGGFTRGGFFWMDPDKSMWHLVKKAGVPEREDGVEKIIWRRDNEIVAQNCVRYIESGKSLRSIGFKSGDQITVTARPKKYFWDVFREGVLPVLATTLSTATSVATVYISYKLYQDRR